MEQVVSQPQINSAESYVDFRRSLPPIPAQLRGELEAALANVMRTRDLAQLTHQSVTGGHESDRRAGAMLLAPRFGQTLSPDRVVLANGTQGVVLLLLRQVVGAGGIVVAERLSYGPLRTLAETANVDIRGLDIDDDGILPESFAAACRAFQPRALYCNPTVQNPTTAIMPEERRREIAAIARRYGVAIIEDDALGRLHTDAPRPIATFAPELTWYVMTTTKCLAHGFRTAYVVPPTDGADKVIGPVAHLSYWHPAPLEAAILTTMIADGGAERVVQGIADECLRREEAALDILGGVGVQSKRGSMHVWLPLTSDRDGAALAARAQAHGILLRHAAQFRVDDAPTLNGLRLSLSTPETCEDLRRGLVALRALL